MASLLSGLSEGLAPHMGGVAVSDRPVVSVCIANYNGSAMISGCIESVLAQDCDFPVEILVHDDASTDGSAETVGRQFLGVRLIRSAENVGFCVANNRMAEIARGQYLLLLNNDAMLWPDALSALHAEAGRLGRPAILTLPQYDAETGHLLDIGCRLDPFLNPVPNRNPVLGDVGTVHGACLWVDKQLWSELGGFPEWFESVGEDLYLCCCARRRGYPVRALGKSGYRHYVGKSFGGGKVQLGRLSTTFRRRALSERNKTFVMVCSFPLAPLLLLLPLHLTTLLLEGAVLSLLKRTPEYLLNIYLPVFLSLLKYKDRLIVCRTNMHASGRALA